MEVLIAFYEFEVFGDDCGFAALGSHMDDMFFGDFAFKDGIGGIGEFIGSEVSLGGLFSEKEVEMGFVGGSAVSFSF